MTAFDGMKGLFLQKKSNSHFSYIGTMLPYIFKLDCWIRKSKTTSTLCKTERLTKQILKHVRILKCNIWVWKVKDGEKPKKGREKLKSQQKLNSDAQVILRPRAYSRERRNEREKETKRRKKKEEEHSPATSRQADSTTFCDAQ